MQSPAVLFRVFLLLLVGAGIGQQVYAQDSSITYLRDPEGRIREHNADFTKMQLNVKFIPKEGRVIGHVKYEFKPIQYVMDTLFLNAPDIIIQSVKLNGKDIEFSSDSLGLTIRFLEAMSWNKLYTLDISYEATPRRGLYFIGWNVNDKNPDNDRYFTRKQIWTQGQGTDNRYWFPCYDDVNDKLLTETTITFDSSYTVVSNGSLKDKKANADGTYTWHYAMNKPMVPYLVMIGIDKYAHKDYKSKNGIVSRQYYYADHPEDATPTYEYSAEMMDYISHETGFNFPWLTYANVPVQDFMFGAMENTTATVYGDFILNDVRQNIDRPYVATNAHELTHQWFGDCITEYSGQNHWLHESFATYYSKQFMHHTYGEDFYQWGKRGEANAAINADKADRFPVASSHGGSARHYPKGSFVIDMIRYVVGDSVFKHSITNYLQKHAYQNVDNHDFMMTFMETAGVNLDWFFDQWVFRAGYPNYEVKYERLADRIAFYVSQTQKTDALTGYFKMPIFFEAHFKDGSSSKTKAWVSHAIDTVYVSAPAGSELDYTLFDAGSNVLKTVSFKRSYDELAAQAEKAKNFIDKYDALLALRDTNIEKKRDLLVRLFNKRNFNAFQNEIILQLGKDRNNQTVDLFKRALHDKDFMVRRSVVDNLEDFPEAIVPDVEKLLQDSSYITVENTVRKLCKLYPAKAEGYLAQIKGMYGYLDNVRLAWLELKSKSDSTHSALYIKPLVDYASNKYEFRTRVHAIEILDKMNYSDTTLIKNLFNASLYTNSRLSGPAIKSLKNILKKPDNRQLATSIFNAGNWLLWQKQILEGILKPA